MNCYKCTVTCTSCTRDTFRLSANDNDPKYHPCVDGVIFVIAENMLAAASLVGPNVVSISHVGVAISGRKS